MEQTIKADTTATSDRLYAIVSDLSTYPEWFDLVAKVEPADPAPVDEEYPAFIVTLRAKVGPFSRSKQLRMIQTESEPPVAQFTRRETDGRTHSEWKMTSRVSGTETGSSVEFNLYYSGDLWSGMLDGVLKRAIQGAIPKLESYAQAA